MALVRPVGHDPVSGTILPSSLTCKVPLLGTQTIRSWTSGQRK